MGVSTKARLFARKPLADRVWWFAIGLLLLASGLTLVIKGRLVLETPISEQRMAPAGCDLQAGPCTVDFGAGGRVDFEIWPRPIAPMKPLGLRARLTGMAGAPSLEVDFRGLDMDMGVNRFGLDRVATELGLVYQGEGLLPICVRERMAWEARVLLYPEAGSDAQARAAVFSFETRRLP